MSDGPEQLEVGRINRPHGLRGELVVQLLTDRVAERTTAGAELRTDAGRNLVLVGARPHQDRWIMSFEGVTSREDADRLRGARLFAPPVDDPDVVFAHQVIGLQVIDQHGAEHGRVTALEANPAADLLVLEDGGLVPLTFLVAVEGGVARVDVPPGLLD
jgi:16S rRNA processing protein RimM